MLEATAAQGVTRLDLRAMREGLYLLRLSRHGVVNTLRFVKQ